jgi:hypothetical protein
MAKGLCGYSGPRGLYRWLAFSAISLLKCDESKTAFAPGNENSWQIRVNATAKKLPQRKESHEHILIKRKINKL